MEDLKHCLMKTSGQWRCEADRAACVVRLRAVISHQACNAFHYARPPRNAHTAVLEESENKASEAPITTLFLLSIVVWRRKEHKD